METTFREGDEKYSALFGNEIIRSISQGSVYFCGMNPGRFIMTALEEANVAGAPFFVVAQDALADAGYVNFLRRTYGGKLGIPGPEDWQRCYDEYSADAQKRMQEQRLEPGEGVSMGEDGKLKMNQVVVMKLNGLLARMIFDKNPSKQFYISESFPLDWTYPHLEPQGLIFKMNREPLAKLSPEIVEQDHDYWTKIVSPMIGDWLNADTSVRDVAAFVEKVYLRHDFSGFRGDSSFVMNADWHRTFSNDRGSIGGLYDWRARQAKDASEKQRMDDAADFAFRQAWALCPYAPKALWRYVQFLVANKENSDALVVAEIGALFRSETGANQFDQLVSYLKRLSKNP
jgi:hypothetical protein